MPGPYDKFCKKVDGIKTYDVFGSHRSNHRGAPNMEDSQARKISILRPISVPSGTKKQSRNSISKFSAYGVVPAIYAEKESCVFYWQRVGSEKVEISFAESRPKC